MLLKPQPEKVLDVPLRFGGRSCLAGIGNTHESTSDVRWGRCRRRWVDRHWVLLMVCLSSGKFAGGMAAAGK